MVKPPRPSSANKPRISAPWRECGLAGWFSSPSLFPQTPNILALRLANRGAVNGET